MILVDANVLLYAYDTSSPKHGTARAWWEERLSRPDPVRLSWATIVAFVRIGTHHRVFEKPLALEEACDHVASWLRQPCVEVTLPGEHHWPILRRLMEATGTAGNLTSDAHIAARALERGAAVCSTDHDFARFPGIRHVNPLATT